MKQYIYSALICSILFTTPLFLLFYWVEKKLNLNKKNEIFYTYAISVIVFAIIFLYTLANKITYIGDFLTLP